MSDDTPKQYLESVDSIAEEALEAEKRGEELSDYVHESVDGSHWVIYTHANLIVLQTSSNESAAFDSMGNDALSGCDSFGAVMMRLAYFAMEQDVLEAVERLREQRDEEAES